MWKCAREVAPTAECAATGPSGPTPDPASRRCARTSRSPGTGPGVSLAFLAGSLSSDITEQTVVIVAGARVHTGPGHAQINLNESVEKLITGC